MNPNDWKIIDQIFDEVLEMPPEKRYSFIAEKCAENEILKHELTTLLKAYEESDNFIENTVVQVITCLFEDNDDTVVGEPLLGQTFGSYKIEKLIGEGGMGEVYLAKDKKLKRNVALKILPPQYTTDDERVKRLIQEARAISKLNHPNIVTIHDIGIVDSTNYITTEFVEGKTLRELINERVTIQETLNIIIQACNALDSAHKAGIIHRDIKPENIMVRPDGYVKILDFGLAKLTETEQTDSLEFVKTLKGTIVGTPTYMSPEQASGSKIDNRTDLWSMAVVLYEMLTGKNPFKKESRQSTIKSILKDNPPTPSTVNNQIPVELDSILSKALEKEPNLSYQTASDLSVDLKRVKREIDSSLLRTNSLRTLPFRKNSSPESLFVGFLFSLIILSIISLIVWYFFLQSRPASQDIDWTKAQNIRLTNQNGTEYFPSIAPNGESFVYTAKSTDNFDIFLLRIGGKNPINLTESFSQDDSQPSFSPDGKLIAFRSERNGGGVFVMQETGENPRRVTDFGFHPSWSPDGKHIVISDKATPRPTVRTRSSIWVVNVENGEKRKLTGNYSYQPAWSPNGKRIAFWSIGNDVSKRDIATVSLDGDKPVFVTNSANTNWNPVWSPDGKYLYFASNRSGYMAIWRIAIDETTGKSLGEAEIVPTPAKYNRHFSFSGDGKRLIYVQLNYQTNLKAVDFNPKAGKPIGETFWITSGDQEVLRPRISPDGKQFVINLARQTQDDIVLIDRDGKNIRDLTNDKYFDRYPIWTADGKQIAFYSDRGNKNQIWIMNSDGSNLRQVTPKDNQVGFPVTSPNGKQITYRDEVERIQYIQEFSDPNKPKVKKLSQIKNLNFTVWDWSNDGKKLVGRWQESDNVAGIGYYNLDTNEYTKVWEGTGTMPSWLPDNKRIVFSYTGKPHILNPDTRELSEIPSIPDDDVIGVGISRDGSLLYYITREADSNIWMLDLSEK